MVKIAPSLLSADFVNLERDVSILQNAGADMLHLDVMDGHFVPNLTFGAPIIKSLRKITSLPLDAHLMITNSESCIDDYINAGVNNITIHMEGCLHLDRLLRYIKSRGCGVGVSLNPATPPSYLEYIIDIVDLILIMTVNPGFGGQTFLTSQYAKINEINSFRRDKNLNFSIQIDGGVNKENAAKLIAAGADILVAGNAVFHGGNEQIANNIKMLRYG